MSNFVCLGSLKGSHLIINEEKYNKLLDEHPATDDGYIHVVGGVIRDNDGLIYLQQNAKLNEFYFPGGKVENDESFEQTLVRELKEEIDINVLEYDYKGCFKLITKGVKRCLHIFDIVSYTGIPTNKEPDKCDNYRVEIIDSDNSLGFALKVDGTITDDVQDILHTFLEINILKNILPVADSAVLQDARFREYSSENIQLGEHYYLYLDVSQKEYFLDIYHTVPKGI